MELQTKITDGTPSPGDIYQDWFTEQKVKVNSVKTIYNSDNTIQRVEIYFQILDIITNKEECHDLTTFNIYYNLVKKYNIINFAVGEVYAKDNKIFYCTKVVDGVPSGWGFHYKSFINDSTVSDYDGFKHEPFIVLKNKLHRYANEKYSSDDIVKSLAFNETRKLERNDKGLLFYDPTTTKIDIWADSDNASIKILIFRDGVWADKVPESKPIPKQQVQEKFSVNTKVVPHKKSVIHIYNFNDCPAWNNIGRDQGFLYVINHYDNGNLDLSNFPDSSTAFKKYVSSYHIDDVTLYKEPTKPEKSNSVKVGEIYEGNTGNMYYVTEIKDKEIHGFGFDNGGKKWFDTIYNMFHICDYNSNYIKKGSKSKWLKLLLEECNRRGLIDGVNFKSVGNFGGEYVIKYCDISFDYDSAFLCNTFGKGLIMKQGKWAEPIKKSDDNITKQVPSFDSTEIIKRLNPIFNSGTDINDLSKRELDFSETTKVIDHWNRMGIISDYGSPFKGNIANIGTKGTDNQDSDFKSIYTNPFKIGDNIEFLKYYLGIPKGTYQIEDIKGDRLIFNGIGYNLSFESINLDIMKVVESVDNIVLWLYGIKYTIGDTLHFKTYYHGINSGLYTIKKITDGFIHFTNGKVFAISLLNEPTIITNLSFEKSLQLESLMSDKQIKTTTNNKQQLIKLKTKFKL